MFGGSNTSSIGVWMSRGKFQKIYGGVLSDKSLKKGSWTTRDNHFKHGPSKLESKLKYSFCMNYWLPSKNPWICFCVMKKNLPRNFYRQTEWVVSSKVDRNPSSQSNCLSHAEVGWQSDVWGRPSPTGRRVFYNYYRPGKRSHTLLGCPGSRKWTDQWWSDQWVFFPPQGKKNIYKDRWNKLLILTIY